MMQYMCEGGGNMWGLLVVAIASFVIAFLKPAKDRPGVFGTGAIVLIAGGMFGMALGLDAVSRNYARFPDHIEAIGAGLGELSHNGTFAAVLALLLGLAALVTKRFAKAAA